MGSRDLDKVTTQMSPSTLKEPEEPTASRLTGAGLAAREAKSGTQEQVKPAGDVDTEDMEVTLSEAP